MNKEFMKSLYDAGYKPFPALVILILDEIATWYWRGIGFGIGIWVVYSFFGLPT